MVLEFCDDDKAPIADFPDVTGLLTCRRDVYDALFKELLRWSVKEFHFRIGTVPYVSFHPEISRDLFDPEHSVYKSRPNRPPWGFRKIALLRPPKLAFPFFSCSQPRTIRFHPIVSAALKEIYDANGLTGLKRVPCRDYRRRVFGLDAVSSGGHLDLEVLK